MSTDTSCRVRSHFFRNLLFTSLSLWFCLFQVSTLYFTRFCTKFPGTDQKNTSKISAVLVRHGQRPHVKDQARKIKSQQKQPPHPPTPTTIFPRGTGRAEPLLLCRSNQNHQPSLLNPRPVHRPDGEGSRQRYQQLVKQRIMN
jgi:hypothetical protein